MPEESYYKFIDATLAEDFEAMRAMLDEGHDVNASNEDGETAFSYCCAHNKLKAAKLLVSHGAEINTVDKGGGSPLDWAVCWSSPEFRQWLTEIGGKRHDDSHEPGPWPLPCGGNDDGDGRGCSRCWPEEPE